MILGVDIGGTNVKFGIVDENYNVVAKRSIPTSKEPGGMKIAEDIVAVIKQLQQEYAIEKIGVGTPGRIDREQGICISAGNLTYENVPMIKMIVDATGIPAILENDANCAIWGELYAGLGKAYKDFAMVTLGTGIGGGIIIDGKHYGGAKGGSGEFGHMTIDYQGKECVCGIRGCWEHFGSVTAIIRQTKEAAEANPGSLLAEYCKNEVNGKTVFDAQAAGCPVAKAVVEQYTDYLLVGIQNIIRALQPEAVVLGGAITGQGDVLLAPIKRKQTVPGEILISPLQNDAGVIGAAAVAIHKI